jgi:putative DNA methylase
VTIADARKKLIEVALPLDEINVACKADKDRKTGTIRNLHKWFAPMPLPAWRALLFAALVDDPEDDERRAYFLDVIKRLVANGADLPDDDTVEEARKIIATQFPDGVPTVMDPFCGGGSTLVEAQRLGLPTYGADLNPVPVLITRTLTELLPNVFGRQPLHPDGKVSAGTRIGGLNGSAGDSALFDSAIVGRVYSGYGGLARDITHYAERIQHQASVQLKAYYPSPPGEIPTAWLWARTATCPSPVCGVETVLATSLWLAKRPGDRAWIQPRKLDNGSVDLDIVTGQVDGDAPVPPKTGRGANFTCLGCGSLIDEKTIIEQGRGGQLGLRLMAVAFQSKGRKGYRRPQPEDIQAALEIASVPDFPRIYLPDNPRWFSGPRFGFDTQESLYTPRQLVTLDTLAGLVASTYEDVLRDGGDAEWAQAIVSVLGLVLGKAAGYGSTQTRIAQGDGGSNRTNAVFARHDLPLNWDFPEINLLGSDSANWLQITETACRAVLQAPTGVGRAFRADAREAPLPTLGLVATDPPYFDAIGYADLSDFFYVWHRRALKDRHPDLYGTVATPKLNELTAIPSHHGGDKEIARRYFINGFTETFIHLQRYLGPGLPMLVVYASKEQAGGREEETRWSSILTAIMNADLEITGTWPIHGVRGSRMIGIGTNAVASYVVMVCRPRPTTAGTCSLADFNRALRRELRPAVHGFQAAGILPVDLAQAAMGPGMQVYSRYRQVLDQSGDRVPIEQALRLINSALGEVLDEQEGELDPHSRFAVAWWEKHGWDVAAFGEADQLARPQGISVDDVTRAEVAHYPRPGFVALLGSGGLNRAWKPSTDTRPTAWEAVHHLADRLISGGGALEAGRLMAELGTFRDPAQALVYRLHDIAAKKGRTKDQERYNALIGSWSDLLAVAATEKDGLF